MNQLHSRLRWNFFASIASVTVCGAIGCASHSKPDKVEMPANAVAPSPSSVRGLEALSSPSLTAGSDASKASAVSEHKLTGNAKARGFGFDDSGGAGGNAGGGTVTFDQLGQMLASLGGHPNVKNGVYIFNIKEDGGLTYPLGVSLSEDQRAIYLVIPLFDVEPQGWANQRALLQLLSANSSICPASFGIVGRRLFLLLGVPNRNVSPDLLKEAMAYTFSTMHKTQSLWGPWMSNAQGGTPGGSETPGAGGAPGGGDNSGGNGGGGNPFGQ